MNTRKLHIGGEEPHPEWEILNIVPGPHVDHVGNAKDLSRFQDNCFAAVYASHVLEHFNYIDEMSITIKEWYRVLQPRGKLYVSVPDLEQLAKLFINKALPLNERFVIMRAIFGGQQDPFDYHYMGFNPELLKGYLINDGGFANIEIVDKFNMFDDGSYLLSFMTPININIIAEKPAFSLKEAFHRGMEVHNSGDLEAAENEYRKILDVQPDYANAIHLLGLIEFEKGNHDTAIELIEKSFELTLFCKQWRINYARLLAESGRTKDAINEYEKLTRADPNCVEAKEALEDLREKNN